MRFQLWCDFLTLLDGVLLLLGQWDIFTLVGPLDFVGTGGGWQWVGWWSWMVMVVVGDGGGW